MKIDIWELIHFSFYKSNIKQTIKYYNYPAQLSGTIPYYLAGAGCQINFIWPDAGSEGVTGASLFYSLISAQYTYVRRTCKAQVITDHLRGIKIRNYWSLISNPWSMIIDHLICIKIFSLQVTSANIVFKNALLKIKDSLNIWQTLFKYFYQM